MEESRKGELSKSNTSLLIQWQRLKSIENYN